MRVRQHQGPVALVALALLGAGLGGAAQGAAQRLPRSVQTDWYFVTDEDGVRVHARDRPGSALPVSRGVGEVQADFFNIAAVLADSARHCEWMNNCMHAERVAATSDFDQVFYNQTSAPWPVANRDLVFRTRTDYRPRQGEMLIRFYATTHPAQPVRGDFVRMPRLDGFYHFRALGPARTMVTLEIDADPGGLIPEWLVKLVTRSYPLDTLRKLRQQLLRTRGVYDAEVVRLRTRYGAYGVKSAASAAAPAAGSPAHGQQGKAGR